MKFKVGDKVINKRNEQGTIQEVLFRGCFVNYGDFAEYETFDNLERLKDRKKRMPTLTQAFRSAEKEQQAEVKAQDMTKLFCEYLAKVG